MNLWLWIAVFVLGLFVGSQLGIGLMCMLHANAGPGEAVSKSWETPACCTDEMEALKCN